MKPPPHHPWPPLVTGGKVSRYIRARDWFLTVLAWVLLVFMLRLALIVIWDYLKHPIFELTHTREHNWGLTWQRLSLFLYIVLGLVIWIIAWGIARRPQLRRSFDPKVTPPLPLEEHATSLGLDPREVEKWRQWRIVTVHFDGTRIATAHSGDTPDPKPENPPPRGETGSPSAL